MNPLVVFSRYAVFFAATALLVFLQHIAVILLNRLDLLLVLRGLRQTLVVQLPLIHPFLNLLFVINHAFLGLGSRHLALQTSQLPLDGFHVQLLELAIFHGLKLILQRILLLFLLVFLVFLLLLELDRGQRVFLLGK